MSSKVKIYTKSGDKGQTRLVDGSCVEKFNPRVEAYGTVDELNSQLGEARSRLRNNPEMSRLDLGLHEIQNELFCVGSLLACEKPEVLEKLPAVTADMVTRMETQIDQMESVLPELRSFILPGGHGAACALHVARTICRRAERRVAELESTHPRHEQSLIYLNRLSDFLFVASRWVNHQAGQPDVLWAKPEASR